MNILVTGGTGGVGRAIVKLLAKDVTNTVYFVYRNSEDTANTIVEAFKNTIAFRCDQTKGEDLEALCNVIPDHI